jgi:6,7-dimethyl-8-ribityllumazine synthase
VNEGRPLEGQLDGRGIRVAVVASRYNDVVVARLLDGCMGGLRRRDVAEEDIAVVRVPGAFELPLVAAHLAKSGSFDAVVALGCVIRGETAHYDLVASQCAAGIARVALDTGIPVVFGVLTTETLDQAMQRSGGTAGDKGDEAAAGAIELASLLRALPK